MPHTSSIKLYQSHAPARKDENQIKALIHTLTRCDSAIG